MIFKVQIGRMVSVQGFRTRNLLSSQVEFLTCLIREMTEIQMEFLYLKSMETLKISLIFQNNISLSDIYISP